MTAAVITGASTGIGFATAGVLANAGFHIYAGVRKDADAARLREALGEAVTPLTMEVTDAGSLEAAASNVRTALAGRSLAGLVCNAGVAVPGPLLHLAIDEFQSQLDINVTGVLRTVQAFAPLLGADADLAGDPGRIVMMSSVAGKMGSPFVGAYAASKHAVEGLSESLRRELMLYGIDVSIIGPGAVATPIWDKAGEIDPDKFGNTDYAGAMTTVREYMIDGGRKGLPPDMIGRTVLHALTAAKPRLRYAVVPQKFTNWTLPRLLPKRRVDAIIAKRIGLERR